MLEILGETVIKNLIEIVTKALQKKIDLSGQKSVKIDTSECHAAVSAHLYMVNNWANEISFKELRGTKTLINSFVDLDLTLGHIPTRNKRERKKIQDKIKLTELLRLNRNFIILGDPGAGKTTSLKRLALGTFKSETIEKNRTPLLIRLRDLGSNSLVEELTNLLGISIQFTNDASKDFKEKTFLRAIGQYLRNIKAILLIDGLDEVPFYERESIIKDLRNLILHSKGYQVITTSRSADFVYSVENASVFAVEPLSDEQILSFATKWLGLDRGKDLLKKIRNTPYGGTEVVPLTLAHLCAIYERSGSIPEKPRTVYRKVVRLLLEEWDEQRSIKRNSKYANFDIDRKEDFLEAIAFHLTVSSNKSSFMHWELENAYNRTYKQFALPKDASREVAREIESHTGLFIEAGVEYYEFAHKSIQEYLCAEHILKLPKIPAELSTVLPNEMALAVGLSSNSNDYFGEVVISSIKRSKGNLENFTFPFIRRILLERADFYPSSLLGELVIALYSETYFPVVDKQLRLPFESTEDIFNDFLSLPSIKQSILEALKRTQPKKLNSGSVYSIKLQQRDLSRPSTASIHYTVDQRFIDLINK